MTASMSGIRSKVRLRCEGGETRRGVDGAASVATREGGGRTTWGTGGGLLRRREGGVVCVCVRIRPGLSEERMDATKLEGGDDGWGCWTIHVKQNWA